MSRSRASQLVQHRDGRLTPVTFQGKELRTQQYLIRHSVKVKAQEHVSSAPLDSLFLSLMNHLYERRPDSSGMRLSGGLNRHLVSRWTRPLSSGSGGRPLMRLPSHSNLLPWQRISRFGACQPREPAVL